MSRSVRKVRSKNLKIENFTGINPATGKESSTSSVKMRLRLQTAIQKGRDPELQRLMEQLFSRYPVLSRRVPLATGSHRVALKELKNVPFGLVMTAFHRIVRHPDYLEAVARGDEKFDIHGNPVGKFPTQEARDYSHRLLEWKRKKRAYREKHFPDLLAQLPPAASPMVCETESSPDFLSRILAEAIKDDSFLDGEIPVQRYGRSGDKRLPLLVVTGDNATGKTVFLSHLSAVVRRHKDGREKDYTIMNIGMKMRTGADGSPGAMRLMMFGSEADKSTGCISLRIVEGSFHNAAQWPVSSVIMLDEPEIGLSETYYQAMAEYIALRTQEMPSDKVPLVVVVTHSHVMANTLVQQGALGIHLQGEDDTVSVYDWLSGGFQPYSMERLLSLPERSRNVQAKVMRVTTAMREKKNDRQS